MNESGRRRGASAISAEVSAFSSGCQRAGSPHVMPARSRRRARPAAISTAARALTRGLPALGDLAEPPVEIPRLDQDLRGHALPALADLPAQARTAPPEDRH